MSTTDAEYKTATIEHIKELLQSLGEFYYLPNYGNLGDLLIAEGTRQYFRRNGIQHKELDPTNPPETYNLVYGGGGYFCPYWCNEEEAISKFVGSHINTCIILPQSFYKVDKFLKALDHRHHIFCRDKASYAYCLSTVRKGAHVYLADDMAFHLQLNELYSQSTPFTKEEEIATHKQIKNGLFTKIREGINSSIVESTMAAQFFCCKISVIGAKHVCELG